MAYICDKKIPCEQCPHYIFDMENDRMGCFAAEDEITSNEKPVFEVSAKVTGYYAQSIEADTEEEAREIFETNISDADFGPLQDIDWDESQCIKQK